MSPSHPKSVGTCTLLEIIGKGGMSEVFRGVQEPLQRQVAVKALLPEIKGDREATERFRREALALANLQHENIVAVHDLIEKYNRLYLIMEYVDGMDLATVIEDGPVPVDIGLLVGSELARALGHAHFRNVIHRDVKPSNVMLSRTGQVKLTDFGIAKDRTKEDLTREGFVIGTLKYLSPEQITGGRADWRSDLYSLGVLLFEAISGQRPYEGEDHGVLLAAIIEGRHVRLREAAAHLPRSVERIVHRCMEVEPAGRYQRAADLRRDLDRLLAAVMVGGSSARLVAFLKERGRVRDDDLTIIASQEVAALKVVSGQATVLKKRALDPQTHLLTAPARAKWILLGMLLALVLAAGGLAATYLAAPDWIRSLVRDTAVWMEPTTEAGSGTEPGSVPHPSQQKRE